MKKPSLEDVAGYREIAALMRSQFVSAKEAADGSQTTLGAIETWSSSLKSAFAILLNFSCPMFLVWDCASTQNCSGERILFYNEAYLSLLKEIQPLIPVDRIKDGWPEDWRTLQADVEQVFTTGQVLQREQNLVLAERKGNGNGHLYVWSYSAVWDETGQIRGVFATGCQVLTEEIVAIATVEEGLQERQELLLSHPTLEPQEVQSSLQQAEAALRESEARFQAFMSHSPASAWIADQDGRLLYLSPTYAQMFQLPPQDAVGKQIHDIYSEEFAQQFIENNRRVFQTGQVVETVETAPRPDGSLGSFLVYKFPIAQASGAMLLGGVAVDVTERQQTEEALRQREEALRLITNALPVLIAYVDKDHYYRFNNQTYETWFGRPAVSLTGQPVRAVLGDAAYEAIRPYIEQVLSGQQVSFESQIPYREGGIRYIRADYIPHTNTQGEVEGFFSLVSDISDRKKIEQERERFLSVGSDLLVITGINGSFQWVSPTFERTLGWTVDEMTSRPWIDFVHPDDVGASVLETDRLFSGNETIAFENRYRHKDGSYRWFLWNARPYPEEHMIYGAAVDITERKQSEEALRQSEEQLRLAQQAAGAGLWDWDMIADRVTWSEEYYWLYGLDPIVTPSYENWLASVLDVDRDRVAQATREALEYHIDLNVEFRILHPSQGERWLTAIGQTFYADDGQPKRMTGIALDITDRKRAEAALRESEARFQAIVRNVPGTIYRYTSHPDGSDAFTYVSEGSRELLELEPETIIQDSSSIWALFHPEDLPALRESVAVVVENLLPWQWEGRLITPSGQLKWIQGRSRPQQTEQGTVWDGLLIDITERKQAEHALRRSEAWARLAIHVGRLGGWRLHLETNLVEMDERMREIWGEPSDAVMIPLPSVIARMHPDDRVRVTHAVNAAIDPHASGTYEIDYRIVWNDGTERWVLAKGQAQFEGKGESRRTVDFFGTLLDITDRKQAEAALAAQEQRYRYIFEAVSVAIWEEDFSDVKTAIDQLKAAGVQDFRQYFVEHPEFVQQAAGMVGLRDVNQAALRMFGTADKTQLLTSLHRIFVPETQEAFVGELLAIAAGEPFFAAETVLQNLQGDRFDVWFVLTLPPMSEPYDRVLVSLLDISGRKRAEVALRDSVEQLSLALTAAKLGDWSWQAATDIVTLSEQAAAIFSIPPGPYTTWTQMQNLLHPDDRERARLQVEQAIAEHSDYDIEYRVMRPDGTERWIAAKGRAQYDSGQVLGMLGVVQDITPRKQADVEREQLLAREQVAREEAERANRIKDEFLAVLSHELRSPLNPILGWSKLLQQGKLDAARTTNALATIERNAKLQAQLIDDLLDISRILRGKLTLNTLPISLSFVITAAIDTVRLAIDAKAIRLKLAVDPEVGQVLGDAARLQQVVWNLLANAAKFTPSGGQITVSLTQVETCAQIQVKDTGKGIHPTFLPHVFDHFRQEDGATTRQFGGLGLGLAIVRQIVEMHGGSVQAESSGEGLGATFTVRLPLAKTGSNQAQTIRLDPPVVDLKGMRVLIVDDEADMREIAAFILEQQGAAVITAASAQEALTVLDHFTPDVLLSDIGMPDMDGYMLIQQVRSRAASDGGQIPAIALSAYAGEFNQQQALAAGFQQHLAKPVEPMVLIEAIANLRHQSQQQEFKP
ncbi:MAG: PAS domain S-box protein [Drouetiella hepatica Uher 2000/2452]|jgi:PAS domain S-box-containing protein|uniref:Circadian input-output histidine kinase CikA n=1 Tax=Drouetiella hepatica Uher 2000/2452 TaxID=904376 RepID=A0A951QEW1_9CYAN|nr:PAS domain S-box protein [Drouetiella hepatica Uher 2000/2452]